MYCAAFLYTQFVEGEAFVVQGEQTSNSDFDTTFLDDKSNLNRLDSGLYVHVHYLACAMNGL